MKCYKCGVDNQQGARFCENCGNDLWSEPKKKNNKKLVSIIAVLIVVVVGAVAVGMYISESGFLGGNSDSKSDSVDKNEKSDSNKKSGGSKKSSNSYEKPIELLIEAVMEKDTDKFVAAYHPAMKSDAKEESKDIKEFNSEMKDEVGDDFELSYKILEKVKIDEDELELIAEQFYEDYDEEVEITDGYEVEIEIMISGENGSGSMTENFIVAKMDGGWYFTDF